MGRPNTIQSIMDRLEMITESGCWIWTGCQRKGYGIVSYKNTEYPVHRLLYEHLIGPIPDGLMPDHLCRVRCCGNPYHTEPVTNTVNVLRGAGVTAINARKTHCVRGHPLSGINLKAARQRRDCRECIRMRDRKRRGYGEFSDGADAALLREKRREYEQARVEAP